MNMTIWKFEVTHFNTHISAPVQRFLTVQKQGNTLVVWAVVDLSAPSKGYTISTIGTGWEFGDEVRTENYISTVQDGGYVWHFFWDEAKNT